MFKKIFVLFFALALPLSLAACSTDPDVESIDVDLEAVELEVGESRNIEVTLSPEDADYDLSYSSSDESIATVSDGVITAVAAGTATITVSAGDVEATISVTVIEEDDDGDDDDDDDDTDTVPPILTVDPSSVTIEYGATYDLMDGVSALDNVDGNISADIEVVSNDDFDSSVPGEYTIEYRVEDSSGNEATATRVITVNELRMTITIDTEDGDMENTYPLAYNPDMYYRDNVNPISYPLGYVTAFDADYYEWMVENQPNRIFAGWSVVVVLDGNGDVYQTRDYYSNTTVYNDDNEPVTETAAANDWCSGSASGGNDEWCTYLGMMANIDVPEDGHVLIFPNGAGLDRDNDEDSPRYFGALYFASSEYVAIDRMNMQVTLNNVPEDLAFDSADARPTLAFERSQLNVNIDKGSEFPDIFENVSASDDLAVDAARIYYYNEDNEEVVVDQEDMTTDYERIYYVRYRIEDSEGRYDVGTRTFTINEPVDEQTENTGTISLGNQSFDAIYNFTDFASEYNMHEGQAYVLSKSYLVEMMEADDDFQVRFSVLAVTDAYGNVVHYRHLLAKEISEDIPFPGAEGSWANNAQLDQDLIDAIPDDGYLVVFPNVSDDQIARETGVQWLYREDGDHSADAEINPLEQRLYFSFEGVETAEKQGTVTFGDNTYDAIYNLNRFFDYSNIRADYDAVFVLDRDHVEKHFEYIEGDNVIVAFSFIAVIDEDGNPQHFRNITPGEISKGDSESTTEHDWVHDADQLKGILDEIPEGGQLVIFANGTDARNMGNETFFNADGDVWGEFTVSDAFNKTIAFEYEALISQVDGYIHVDGESYEATHNLDVFFKEGNIGSEYPVVQMLDYTFLKDGLAYYAEENDDAVKIVQYGFLVALDDEGKAVALRSVLGEEVLADNPDTVNDDPDWANSNQLDGILDYVPEDGSLLIFHNGDNDEGVNLRNLGSQLFWSAGSGEEENEVETFRNAFTMDDAFSKVVEFSTQPIQD